MGATRRILLILLLAVSAASHFRSVENADPLAGHRVADLVAEGVQPPEPAAEPRR